MIEIINLSVSSYDVDNLNIYWDITPTSETLTDYALNLYRSATPEFSYTDYDLIASGIHPNDYDYQDTTLLDMELPYNDYREIYYTLQPYLIASPTVTGVMPTPESMGMPMDYVAREIIYRQRLALQTTYYAGRVFKVLKRLQEGTHCTNCWDETTQRRLIDKCPVCYDTGWVGGFYNPIEVNATLSATPNNTELAYWGEVHHEDTFFTVGPYPHVQPRDVVIDKDNQRWNVVNVRSLTKGIYTINQTMQLRPFMKDQIIYEYPITWTN